MQLYHTIIVINRHIKHTPFDPHAMLDSAINFFSTRQRSVLSAIRTVFPSLTTVTITRVEKVNNYKSDFKEKEFISYLLA